MSFLTQVFVGQKREGLKRPKETAGLKKEKQKERRGRGKEERRGRGKKKRRKEERGKKRKRKEGRNESKIQAVV